MTQQRELPNNPMAEKGLLGTVMRDPSLILELATLVQPSDFYDQTCSQIYEGMLACHKQKVNVSLVSLSTELRRKGMTDIAPLLELLDATVFVNDAPYYAGIVLRTSKQRTTIAATLRALGILYEDRDDAVGKAVEIVSACGMASLGDRGFVSTAEICDRVLNDYETGNERSLPTGFTWWDTEQGGLWPGHLIIIAAGTSVGKTAFASQVALNIARPGKQVMIYTAEMPSDEYIARMASAIAGVSGVRARQGKLTENELARYVAALSELSSLKIFTDDMSGSNVERLRGHLHRHMAEHGKPDLLIVDYLQLLGGKSDDDFKRVSNNSQALKQLAKEIDIPVMALSQFNRAGSARGVEDDSRPQLHHLRSSGQIEQDADEILFLMRRRGESETLAIMAKSRSGPVGEFPLHFAQSTFTFSDPPTYRAVAGYDKKPVPVLGNGHAWEDTDDGSAF